VQVFRAKVLGFCMGVRRAEELAISEAKQSNNRSVYTLGPLVHNPVVLAGLKRQGIIPLDDPPPCLDDLIDCSIVIRAHGVSFDLEMNLRERGARIVDATCPNVKKSQLKAQELSRAGYCIFLAGEAQHAEIKGILSFARDASFCEVAGSVTQAEEIALALHEKDKDAKTAIIGQTTISEDEYQKIANAIKNYFPNLETIDTICSATKDRQQALRELLQEVDAVIVAGGKESANTRRLLAIAQASGKFCALVENAKDIPLEFYEYEKVGICAGASTPDSVISDIELELLR
jgi:4-hydroxy-3-methylbut-2-enyl diphosphate reductase